MLSPIWVPPYIERERQEEMARQQLMEMMLGKEEPPRPRKRIGFVDNEEIINKVISKKIGFEVEAMK